MKRFTAKMFGVMSSFAQEKPAIVGIQRKGLATEWLLKEAVKSIHGAKFWLHRGLCNSLRNIFTRNGIHLNDEGLKRFIEATEEPFYSP